MNTIQIADREIGEGHPTYFIADIRQTMTATWSVPSC